MSRDLVLLVVKHSEVAETIEQLLLDVGVYFLVFLHDDFIQQLEGVKLLSSRELLWTCFDNLLYFINSRFLNFELCSFFRRKASCYFV